MDFDKLAFMDKDGIPKNVHWRIKAALLPLKIRKGIYAAKQCFGLTHIVEACDEWLMSKGVLIEIAVALVVWSALGRLIPLHDGAPRTVPLMLLGFAFLFYFGVWIPMRIAHTESLRDETTNRKAQS